MAEQHDGLADFISEQNEFSQSTFGPGARTKGVIEHIRKELAEVENDPADVFEWVDIAILAIDGALRNTGCTPQQVADALRAKLKKNKMREWPDWRVVGQDRAIEHIRRPV